MTKTTEWTVPVLKQGMVSANTNAGPLGATDAGIFS